MSVVICPGIHDPQLTQGFLAGLTAELAVSSKSSHFVNLMNFSVQDYSALSGFQILQFLRDTQGNPPESPPIVFISFSAGVVGAIASAWGWQLLGGQVKSLIAIDGWGVPLFGNFPIHRLSHDYFTHWSSSLLGSGEDSFYADPLVEHLQLWRSPQTVAGWWVTEKAPFGFAPFNYGGKPSCSAVSPCNDGAASDFVNPPVGTQPRTYLTATQFLSMLLERYNEI